MRKLDIAPSKYTEVFATDERGPGNANHDYVVRLAVSHDDPEYKESVCTISFQKGPVKENDLNGIHTEDLIAIVIDHLLGFQSGPYACEENDCVLLGLRNALRCLNERTSQREARGVEGTLEV